MESDGMTEVKTCSRCGETKPVSEFSKYKAKKDGLQVYCKPCVAEYNRKYREENKEKCAEYNRKYREENKEKIVECNRKYREENKEKELERHRKYREENKEKCAERNRKYNKCVANPSCPAVGSYGAEFLLFTCEVCGKEFRRRKAEVDWNYEHRGTLPRFCSKDCQYFAKRKDYQSPYHRRVKNAKRRLKPQFVGHTDTNTLSSEVYWQVRT